MKTRHRIIVALTVTMAATITIICMLSAIHDQNSKIQAMLIERNERLSEVEQVVNYSFKDIRDIQKDLKEFNGNVNELGKLLTTLSTLVDKLEPMVVEVYEYVEIIDNAFIENDLY